MLWSLESFSECLQHFEAVKEVHGPLQIFLLCSRLIRTESAPPVCAIGKGSWVKEWKSKQFTSKTFSFY